MGGALAMAVAKAVGGGNLLLLIIPAKGRNTG